jgi:hypothetical protein
MIYYSYCVWTQDDREAWMILSLKVAASGIFSKLHLERYVFTRLSYSLVEPLQMV